MTVTLRYNGKTEYRRAGGMHSEGVELCTKTFDSGTFEYSFILRTSDEASSLIRFRDKDKFCLVPEHDVVDCEGDRGNS